MEPLQIRWSGTIVGCVRCPDADDRGVVSIWESADTRESTRFVSSVRESLTVHYEHRRPVDVFIEPIGRSAEVHDIENGMIALTYDRFAGVNLKGRSELK